MEDAAIALDCARSRISHMETGRYGIRKPDLEVLVRLYGALDRLDDLEELRREGSARGWWSTYRLPDYLAGYVGLEADATSLRAFELELIPGLLQTEAYARAVHIAGHHMVKADEIEHRVAARIQRQARVQSTDRPLELVVVVSEAALRRTLAMGDDIANGQLAKLASAAGLPNVSLQILPFRVGAHRSMAGSFAVLGFAPGVSPDVAYQDHAVGGHLVDDGEVVRLLSALHDELRDQALDADESLTFVSELARRQ